MKQSRSSRRAGCGCLTGLTLLLLVCLCAFMYLESRFVKLNQHEVYLSDLPAAFDGTTILFVSDLHSCYFNPAGAGAALLRELNGLNPDLLLLGGDYSYGGASAKDAQLAARNDFFLSLKDFYAPLGKFAVRGNHDIKLDGLSEAMRAGGVSLLTNEAVRLTKGGSTIVLAGLDDWKEGSPDIEKLAALIPGGDAAIVLSHNPDAFPAAVRARGKDGSRFFDLMLSGHTHAGQIAPFGRALYVPSAYGSKYLAGWFEEDGARLLVSAGVGTVFLPLRLGAAPSAEFITLRRG